MIAPADVNKLECKLVLDILDYFKCKKTIIEPQSEQIGVSLFLYASYLTECLTNSQLCQIKDMVLEPCEPAKDLTCADQLQLSITKVPLQCTISANLVDPFPSYVLTDNSPYVDIYGLIHNTDSCSYYGTTLAFAGGCTSTGCSTNKLGFYQNIWTHKLTNTWPTAHISYIKVYKTDDLGNIDPTPIDLDLRHGISPYYTTSPSCPLCVNVPLPDTLISSPNFPTAFAQLLQNAATTIYSNSNPHHDISVTLSGTNLKITQLSRHKASEYIGLLDQETYFNLYDVSASHSWILRPKDVSLQKYAKSIQVYYNAPTLTTPCGPFSPNILDQAIPLNYTPQTNFAFIGLPPKASTSLTLTDRLSTCVYYKLIGKANALVPVTYEQWSVSYTPLIYLGNEVFAQQIGTYYYYVETSTGCSATISETITSFPLPTLTPYDPDVTAS